MRLDQCDSRVSIQVHDSGPGLTETQAEHLFEAFYTTKPDGNGLGLAVSRELVTGMGGELRYLDRQPGATFEVELPTTVDREYAQCHDTDR